MNPTSKAASRVDNENREIVRYEQESPSINNTMTSLANDIFAKYPLNSTVTKLNSTFEIKQNWLFNEWASECQFSKYIRPNFPSREDLYPKNQNPNTDLIHQLFMMLEGNGLFGNRREKKQDGKKLKFLILNWIGLFRM